MLRRLGSNVAAGAVSSLAALLGAIISTPLLLRILGRESFGVLSFVLTLQAAMLVLDGGIALSVTRVVAQDRESHGTAQLKNLLFGLARVNWIMAGGITACIASSSFFFAKYWLNLITLSPIYVAQALALAAVAIGARWPLALYQGILNGAQRQVTLGLINVTATVLSTVGALALVGIVAADLRVLFAWLAAITLAQVLWSREAATRAVGEGVAPPAGEVTSFYRQSAAAGWLGVIGLLLMQADKVLLSKILPIDVFGYYVLASMVAGALYVIVTPMFHALYPQFSALAADGNMAGLERLYRASSLALAAVIFPIAAVLAFFSESVIRLWTSDQSAAAAAGPIVKFLALGTAMHGVMFMPYALKLACGASKLALVIGASLLVLSLPAAVFAALEWGASGAAAGWLVLNLTYLVLGSELTHRRLLPGIGFNWLAQDIGPCALLSLIVGMLGAWWARVHALSPLQSAGLGIFLVIVCWTAIGCTSSRVRGAAALIRRKTSADAQSPG